MNKDEKHAIITKKIEDVIYYIANSTETDIDHIIKKLETFLGTKGCNKKYVALVAARILADLQWTSIAIPKQRRADKCGNTNSKWKKDEYSDDTMEGLR